MTPRFKAEDGLPTNSGQIQRALPVLFHLMDVSRPRRQPTVIESPEAARLTGQAAIPQLSAPEHENKSLEDLPVPAFSAPQVEAAAPPAPLVPSHEAKTVSEPVPHEPFVPANPGGIENVPVTLEVLRAADKPIAAQEAEAHTATLAALPPRPRPTDSRRKLKTPIVENWFQVHGKYIALGFVLALIATIYFAKVNRQSRPVATAESDSVTRMAEHASKSPQPLEAPLVKAAVRSPENDLEERRVASKVSPALLAGGPDSTADSKAELHPPAASQRAVEAPPAEKSPADDGLFQFSKKNEQHLATRAEAPTMIANPTIPPRSAPSADVGNRPSTPNLPPSGPAMAATPFPTHAPVAAYPQTSFPTAAFVPATSNLPSAAAPPGVPASPMAAQGPPPAIPDMRSQYQMPTTATAPQAPPGWLPAPAPNVSSSPYPSQDQAAPGFRYERTGSGLY